MSSISNRVTKLEHARGDDDFNRYLRSLTDEELEQVIAEHDAKLRSQLEAEGIDTSGIPLGSLMELAAFFPADPVEKQS